LRVCFCGADPQYAGRTIERRARRLAINYDALSMTEDQIRVRLLQEGYKSLSADPAIVRRIKEAAATARLAVSTPEHISAHTEPPIDARPQR
jgi:hypothetical protein